MYLARFRRLLEQRPSLGIPTVALYLLLRAAWIHRRVLAMVVVSAGMGLLFSSFPRPHYIAISPSASPRKPTYLLTDLGTLNNQPGSGAADINNKGQVVGWFGVQYRETHAFLWQNGIMRDLGAPHGTRSAATALNDKGQIVGWSGSRQYTNCRAVLWGRKVQLLDSLPGCSFNEATDVNNNGVVCGTAFNERQRARSTYHGFVWQRGRLTDIGTLPEDDESAADGINDAGQVVGYSRWYNYFCAVRYENGQMCRLAGWGDGKTISASAINRDGNVVGTSEITRSRSYFQRACLWKVGQENTPIDLGTLGGGKSAANDINRKNQVVGWSYVVDDNREESAAFLWQHDVMYNLNDCIASDSGWVLCNATAINDKGQIVGVGIISGHTHAFLLTPK